LAYDQGYSVNASPQVGAIVSWPAGILGAWGHVAIVEGVNANGTINVSEYNWVRYSYSERYNVPYWNYGNASFIY
jgi:surface antigen